MSLPLEIVGLGKPEVTFIWDEGHEGTFSARDLRLRCHCAHCVDEVSGAPLLDPGRVAEGMTVSQMELIGTYGVRITFADGHGTGIYRFRDLFATCPCDHCVALRPGPASA